MRQLNVPRHRLALRLAQALIKHTLELKLGNALVLLDLGLHLEQPIASSNILDPRRVAAPHNDTVRRVRDDLKVVCDLCADGVTRLGEFLALPEL